MPVRVGQFRLLARLIGLAALVGIVAGLGAVAFQVLSGVVVKGGLGFLAGYSPGGPINEVEVLKAPAATLLGGFSPWMLLAVISAGGLISGLIVYTLAPEAEGHGTDAAIRAYHRNRGLIRPIVPLVKIVASAVTIGTGGSGGREGPIAQIGAGFGSLLAVRLRLSEYERRILLAAGLGAGIAAIFRAPLAGAIFAIEVMYREEDFEAEALIPAFIACTVAYCTFGLSMRGVFAAESHFDPIFMVVVGLKFDNPALLVPLTVLAVLMVGASWLYVRGFYGITALFARLPLPKHFRPMVGALLTGLVGLGAYYALAGVGPRAQQHSLNVLSFGYGLLQDTLVGRTPYALWSGVLVLTVVGLGKLLTTSLTIGSGGSGGVFGPSMVIGGSLGGAVGLLFHHYLPSAAPQPEAFVILGMASFFSAAAKTPVSTIIMVSELTAGYELLLPAMWVAALAYLLSRPWSIYREQVKTRIQSPAHRSDFIINVLKGKTVREILPAERAGFDTVSTDTPMPAIQQLITRTTQTVFPVVDAEGLYVGLFGINDVREFLYERQMGSLAIAQDLVIPGVQPLRPDTDLSAAMWEFARLPYEELPVIADDGSRRIMGMLGRREILAAYNLQLRGHEEGQAEDETASE
ncbi:MAG: H(+)/Cl(-) exchange transporter ClcA [Planctomycetes bacterium ADurb.Bin126]|nr:MAG: H(+)/Cl(-) exchange transporter ClcA [Planctomycetes bacterium ADurb.Bin126]